LIALPPLNGGRNDTVTCALPATTVGCAGASGTRFGIATADGTDDALSPFAFVAVSVHVYDFPLVKPGTTIGEAAPAAVPAVPPFDDTHVASYPVIGLPPLKGATNETVSWPFPTPAVGWPGAVGTVLGIATADAGDDAPGPFAFVAVTVHVYDLPFDSDPTTIGEAAPEFVPVTPPFDETHVASYLVIGRPPSAGAENDTVITPFPTASVGCAGASGTVLGLTAPDVGDDALVPFAFVAVTVHV